MFYKLEYDYSGTIEAIVCYQNMKENKCNIFLIL